MSNWFSEDFALGPPLRDPIGAGATDEWNYYDAAHTSAYAKLVRANDYAGHEVEVDATAGVGGTPALVSKNTALGSYWWATFAILGTAGARVLTTPDVAFALDADVKFTGATYERLRLDLYGDVSMGDRDLLFSLFPSGANLICWVEYAVPNGSDFGVNFEISDAYVIGTKGDWIAGGAFHHVRVEAKPGTVTTWTPGTLVSGRAYTGGALAVASDGYIKVFLDTVEVLTLTGIPLILNFDGESANESSPGSWTPASRETRANVNTLSLIDLGFPVGSPIIDNVTLGPIEGTWVDVPNFKREWIDASRFPGGAARCLCMLWATVSGVNVQARLVSLLADGVTVDAVVGTSADITAVVPTDATFAVTLTGNKRHKLQLTSSTPLTDLWCAPGAKVAP